MSRFGGPEVLMPVPDGLDLRSAAAVLHDGPTALSLVELAAVRPGEWALVVPAGGGMGILLISLLRSAGARVIAGARGRRKLELARELGAEITVDYSAEDWAEAMLKTAGSAPSLVFDGVGGQVGGRAYSLIVDGGRFFSYGAPSGEPTAIPPADAERRGLSVTGIFDLRTERQRHTSQALEETAAGRLRPVIGQTFALADAAKAHAAIESRAVLGKTLLLT